MDNNQHYLSLVESSQFNTFLEALEMTQWDIYAMLEKAQLPKDFAINQSEGVILTERVSAVLNLIEVQLPETELLQYITIVAKKNALKIVQALPLQNSQSVEQALVCFINESFRSAPDSQFSLLETLGNKWLVRHLLPRNNSLAIIECYLLKLFHELVCLITQSSWQPTRIFLQSSEHLEVISQRCEKLFNSKEIQLVSQREVTGVEISEDILTRKVNLHHPVYHVANSESNLGKDMRTTSGALRYVLPHYLSGGRPSLELAAELCGLHSRTLKRRLHAEGMTYSALLDEVIVNHAKDALLQSKYSVTDIAINLGYPYANHFSRMFKRLTGFTPKDYRNSSK